VREQAVPDATGPRLEALASREPRRADPACAGGGAASWERTPWAYPTQESLAGRVGRSKGQNINHVFADLGLDQAEGAVGFSAARDWLWKQPQARPQLAGLRVAKWFAGLDPSRTDAVKEVRAAVQRMLMELCPGWVEPERRKRSRLRGGGEDSESDDEDEDESGGDAELLSQLAGMRLGAGAGVRQ
jgi:hypothetical protein